MTLSITAFSARGAIPDNQDSLLLENSVITAGNDPFVLASVVRQSDVQLSVFTVADGAGGAQVGQIASEAALRSLSAERFIDINDLRERIDERFERIQTAVLDALSAEYLWCVEYREKRRPVSGRDRRRLHQADSGTAMCGCYTRREIRAGAGVQLRFVD